MEDIDGGLHPAVDGQSLDEMRWDEIRVTFSAVLIFLCWFFFLLYSFIYLFIIDFLKNSTFSYYLFV